MVAPGGAAAGRDAPRRRLPLPASAARPAGVETARMTSRVTTSPSGPLPASFERSRCSRSATRWARWRRGRRVPVGRRGLGRRLAGRRPVGRGRHGVARGFLGGGIDLGERRADRRPWRPRSASTARTTPEAGAGTSTSTLSVVTSTSVAPASIHCPGFTRHSTIEPSLTDSPISGRVTLTIVSGTQGLRCSARY
jgi:hypothetical protein